MNNEEKTRILEKGVTAAKTSALVTIGLTALKAIVGYLSGSVALSADAIHSLSDAVTIIAVWLGLRLSKRRPSERFPYGFYRVEALTFLLVSVFIAVSGVQILIESFQRAVTPYAVTLITVTLPVAASSASISWLLFRYKSHVGGEIKSQALTGEATHSMIDVWSSVLVFVGILAQYIGLVWAEPAAGFLIGLLIVSLGVRMSKDAILALLDACLDPKLISQMRQIAKKVEGVKGVHDVKVRKSGPFVFAEMHVEMDSTLPVAKAELISETIDHKVRASINLVDSLLIHAEPMKKDVYRIALPVEQNKGLNSKVSLHFGKSPCFIFIDLAKNKPRNWFVAKNPGARMDKKKGIEAAHLLIEHKADVVLAKEVGDGPYHVLRDGSIQILELDTESEIKHILDAFARKKLKSLTPTQSDEHELAQ